MEAINNSICDVSTPADILSRAEGPLMRAEQALETTHAMMAGQIQGSTAELEAARLARLADHAERGRLLTRRDWSLDALPGGVVILDADGKLSEANPQAARLLGEQLEGQTWAAVEAGGR